MCGKYFNIPIPSRSHSHRPTRSGTVVYNYCSLLYGCYIIIDTVAYRNPDHCINTVLSPAVADIPVRRLKSGSRVTQRLRKWHHSIACLWFPITVIRPIGLVTLCLKCTVFEIWRHIGQKSQKKPTPLSFDALCPSNPKNIRINLILLETGIFTFFSADGMGLSSYKFLRWAPKDICVM